MPSDVFALRGGLDQTTDYMTTTPGRCIGAKNFEPNLVSGYSRIAGYERFDGLGGIKPHLQTYTAITVADASVISLNVVITGDTSGATATVVAKDEDSNTIGVTRVSGTFIDGEGTDRSTTITEVLGEELGPAALDGAWILAAQDYWRALISAVPGEGSVLGVHKHEGTVYAFRNAVGGASTDMFKSSGAGWTQISMPTILAYDAGSGAEIEVGDTVVGGTSGASAAVLKVVTYDGTWGVDAAGYLVLDTVTGGPYSDGENLSVSTTRAVADGASYTHALSPDGVYTMKSYNFYALSTTNNMYGADGVNPAFEFDGTTFLPILMPGLVGAPETNAPTLIERHKGHLFLMFADGLVQHSVQGEPCTFNGFLGAAEFGLGAEGTALVSEVGGPLLMRTARETFALEGSGVADWALKKVSSFGGSIIHTTEQFGDVFSLDSKGIVSQSRVEQFGDFEEATVTRTIQPSIDSMVPLATRSVVVRNKNQYRVFGSDNSFIIMVPRPDGTFEFMPCAYDTDVTCITNSEESGGTEEIYFGSSDGFVYQAEVGNSFDGEEIESYLHLPFTHSEYPRHRKRYRYAWIDLEVLGSITLRLSAEIQYGLSTVLEPKTLSSVDIFGGQGGFWDESDWDTFYWDSQTLSNLRFPLTGTGVNIALTLYHSSATTDPFTVEAVHLDYDIRRKDR